VTLAVAISVAGASEAVRKVHTGVAFAGALLTMGATQPSAVRHDHAAERCRVSRLSHPVPGRPSFNFGNARIAVDLPRDATFLAVPDGRAGGAFIQKDGWIRTKVGWFTARGTPVVSGRRVDGTGRRLRADVGPSSYAVGAGPFYPSLLYFPSFGCWRITATAGGARLDAVVSVMRSTHRG
jgi:hypothetical protein